MTARVIKPPEPLDWSGGGNTVFLAGSVEMGKAEPWQEEVTAALGDVSATFLNPRRDSWDASWAQSIDNPMFRQQVEWELEAQERADLIAMYFAPQTRAPITLLELGLFAQSGRMVVCCPEGFWRRGNVEVVCHRYQVPQVGSLGELIAFVRRFIEV